MTNEQRKKLEYSVKLGNSASCARDCLDIITDAIIQQAKNDFENLPIIDYQDIDKRSVFVLQLKIEIAKEIRNKIRSYIANGEKAVKELRGEE